MLIRRIRVLLRELMTPSNNGEGAGYRLYIRSVIAGMHTSLGIGAVTLLMALGITFNSAAVIVLGIYAMKEVFDYLNNGTVLDRP